MRILVTGGTGFLGGYVVTELLDRSDARLLLLTRAGDRDEGARKLWAQLQLHMDARRFYEILPRIEFVNGDLEATDLGLDAATWRRLAGSVDSVFHAAASLNRKSEKKCLNANLRGTLSVARLARAIHDDHGLRRLSFVSAIAVAGKRAHQHVHEDEAIDWELSDWDPYARTKKFCEHLLAELLPDVPQLVFRPPTVLGDSRFPQTTQFDMVRAVGFLAELPALPLPPDAKFEVVSADWTGRCMARLHLAPAPKHRIYHLTTGRDALTLREVRDAIGSHRPFLPRLGRSFELAMRAMNRGPHGTPPQAIAASMKVFWPYITKDVTFDNTRVVSELGEAPIRFDAYGRALVEWAKQHHYRFDPTPLPPLGEVDGA